MVLECLESCNFTVVDWLGFLMVSVSY